MRQMCLDCNPQHDLVKLGTLESPTAPDTSGAPAYPKFAELSEVNPCVGGACWPSSSHGPREGAPEDVIDFRKPPKSQQN